MTTQYTPILKLALPVTGELSGTWGDVVNDNITSMVEQAIAGLATISTWTGNSHTLTTANGTTSESRCAMLVAQNGAGLTAAGEVVCPASSKLYVLKNDTSYAITLKTAAGTGVAVASGNTAFLFCDGTNVNACVTTIVDGRVTGNLTVDGNATINGNTTLGNATSDTITATARFNTDLLPSTDNARDLGSTANSWKDLYIDGTAYLALVDINGGTIDGVSIGASTAATIINVDNLRLDGNTISSTDTNGNVVIAPNGTGDVQLDADTVRVGDSGAAATLTSNGAGALTVTTGGAADLTLSTNSGTTSGTIVIANGAGGNITLTPEGTGDVILSADRVQIGDANTDTTLTTNGTGSLNLTTNNGTNSGTIQIAQGANGNITLTPNGTGSVSVPKLVWSNGTATRVPYLTTGGQFTDSANLTFNGTDLTVSGAVNAGSVNATTLDLTNLEVTNIKAKDGTAAMTIADSTGAVTVSSNFSTQGNTTLGNAAADNVTVTGTITSNLIFTDNTYNIGANGATRPASAWFSKTVTAGQGTGQNWQFLATDYGQGTGGGMADGIYTNSIKAGTFQGFGFDTQYQNAGSWVSSQTSASIIDGYQGNFRFFGRNDLTAGVAYTPALRFTVGPTGLASLWTVVAADPGITNSLTIGRSSYDATYGGYIGLRAISADSRQGLFMRSTGTLTGVAQYNIDFITGQTSVPLAADTGLAMRINQNGTVAIGGSTSNSYPLEIFASGSASTTKNLLNLYYSAAGAAEVSIQFQTANGGIGKLGFITSGASAGKYLLYTGDGSAYANRYSVDATGTHIWTNVGGSGLGDKMILNSTGLGIGGTPLDQFTIINSSGNSYAGMRMIGSNRGGYIDMYNLTYPVSRFITDQSGNLTTQTAAGFATATMYDRLIIGSDGSHTWYNVGVTTGAVKMLLNSTGLGVNRSPSNTANFRGNGGDFDVNPAYYCQFAAGNTGYINRLYGGSVIDNFAYVGNMYYDNSSAWVTPLTVGSAITFGDGSTYFYGDTGKTAGTPFIPTLRATLTANAQLKINTSTTVYDAYTNTIYASVVAGAGIAYTPQSGSGGGQGSLVGASINTAVNTTYTVDVYPSDSVYDVLDIRVGGYSSSGSGSASAYFAYGGHTGAYQLTTVFNNYTGNVTISSPSVTGGKIRFTITIANSGSAGVYLVKVSDLGATPGRTAAIVIS